MKKVELSADLIMEVPDDTDEKELVARIMREGFRTEDHTDVRRVFLLDVEDNLMSDVNAELSARPGK